ncbi:hypothetical protein ACFCV3_32065 [Kribbella sp. NPDC056345]
MSQPAEDPESTELPAEQTLNDDPNLHGAIWDTLHGDFTSEDF